MIISKTPFRMSFFGGGTDMPDFFNEFGGSVISTAIDKYCYVTVRHLPPFFDYHSEVSYSRIERVRERESIEHPLVRNAMEYKDIRDVRITYEADLPAKSGLGTSSSFAVGMLNAFYKLKGKDADKKRLADDAIYVERKLCNEAGGWQDQIAAAYGGFNRIDFKDDDYLVTPIKISESRKKMLEENIMMFFTGFTRFSADIQKESKSVEEKKYELKEMLSLVDTAQNILEDETKDISEFGRLLDATWKLKKKTGSKVSTDVIDAYYKKALDAGALGGKLLGAGGGGFLAFYVDKDRRQSVMDAMGDLMFIPTAWDTEGSRIIYFSPETYSYRGAEK